MAKLYFNTRDELNCIETDMIAFVQANGNYSRVVYITKREVMLTQGISKLEKILKTYNSEPPACFNGSLFGAKVHRISELCKF